MNIYLISQKTNNDYDTFDAAIVYANNEKEAKNIHPNGELNLSEDIDYTWTSVENVEVQLIGTTSNPVEIGVILASFNAG